jgi:voltage-gated potassium channel
MTAPSTREAIFNATRVRKRLKALFHQPIFWFITIWGHLAIIAGTVAFHFFESGVNPQLKGWIDTIFWTVATVTTVGYGNVIPTTTGGKVVGICMMIVGSLFLWSYTALFAGALISPDLKSVEEEVADLEKELELDERALKQLQQRIDMLIAKKKP